MQLYQAESLENSVYIEVESVRPPEISEIGPALTNNQKKSLRRARELVGKNKGRWSQEEQRQYFRFLMANLAFFEDKGNRRFDKVFKLMAGEITTRTSDQCRTHHQKLEFRHKKLAKIVESLKLQCGQVENSKNQERYEEPADLEKLDYFNSTGLSAASKVSQSTQNSEGAEIHHLEDFYLGNELDNSIELSLEEVDLFVTNIQQTNSLTFLD